MSFKLMKPLSIPADVPFEKISFPQMCSTKLDGIRACVQNGQVLSNSGTPIASPEARRLIAAFEGFDGEFGYGDPTAKDFYSKTQSAVNSKTWPVGLDPNELRFYVFDLKKECYTAKSR